MALGTTAGLSACFQNERKLDSASHMRDQCAKGSESHNVVGQEPMVDFSNLENPTWRLPCAQTLPLLMNLLNCEFLLTRSASSQSVNFDLPEQSLVFPWKLSKQALVKSTTRKYNSIYLPFKTTSVHAAPIEILEAKNSLSPSSG
jgi:hypothetical protein